jgi:small subunit ribosomal protein S21
MKVRPHYDGEPLDLMLRRFKKKCSESGLTRSIRRHEYALSPSRRRRQKRTAAMVRRRRESAA